MARLKLAVFGVILLASLACRADDAPKTKVEDGYPPAGNYSHPYFIGEGYDKFGDKTSLSLSFGTVFSSISDRLSLTVYRVSGGAKRSTGNVYFSFHSTGRDGWRYLKYHPIVFLVDGERWTYEPDHDGEVERGYVTEGLFISVSEERFKKLIYAKSIEIKVGVDVIDFVPDCKVAIKEFASLLADPEAKVLTPEEKADAEKERERKRKAELFKNRPMETAEEKSERLADEKRTQERAKGEKAQIRLNSAKAFEKDKNLKMAIKYYKEVVSEFGSTPQAIEAKKRLKELGVDVSSTTSNGSKDDKPKP